MLLVLTRQEIEANIARAHGDGKGKYNRLHHLQAMLMLGQYYYFKCRLLEGHVYISQAVRFAIALGVHRLDSYKLSRYTIPTTLGRTAVVERWRPRDRVELGEGINVWWACAVRDLSGSVMNGLPPSISLDEITTVWPRSLLDFESGRDLLENNHSVAALLGPEFGISAAEASQDTVGCVQAKGCILMCMAGKLDTERISGSRFPDDWWARFEHCDHVTQKFIQTAPPSYASRDPIEASALAQVYTVVECGTLALHSALAEYELFLGTQGGFHCANPNVGGRSYTRCVDACRNISLAARQLESLDMSCVHMIAGITWICAAQVLSRNIPRLRLNGRIGQAQEMGQQVLAMRGAMDRLVAAYPLMTPQADQLRTMINMITC